MEQKKVTLEEFLDLLGQDALKLVQNIQTAREGAKQQIATIATLEAKVKALESANKGRKGR